MTCSPLSSSAAWSLTSQVEAHLREHIQANGLVPGDQLPGENEISRLLGISRPVVREASQRLAAVGLIEVAPGRPPRVGRLQGGVMQRFLEGALLTGQGSPLHILEVRRGLEIGMVGLAAKRTGGRIVPTMRDLLARMADALDTPEIYVGLDMTFHLALAEAADNPMFSALIGGCRDAFEASMAAGLRHRFGAAELARVQELHVAIVDAVAAGDAGAAERAMTQHFDDALAALYRAAETTGDKRGSPS